ncbi:immunoglobulin superfamily DCC subclass member 3-like [Glandiceps talaboti]
MDVKWKTVYIVITVLMLNCSLSYCTIVFRREPTDKTVIQGNPVTFHCVTENTQSSGASLQIQWKLNGNYINTGTRHLLFQNGSLYISQTQAADQGDYVCVVIVIGQPGSTESRPAHLSFAYINVVAHSPQSVNAEDGQMRPAYFQCVSGKSQPLVSIHWEKDGVTFTEGVTYQTEFAEPGSLQMSGTLQINNVKKDHEGSYRCVTVNPYLPNQPMRSDYATLTVNPLYGPPYIEVAPQNVTAGLNNPASIECTIVGNPQPVISWHKAGESQPIQSTATRFILDGTLQFTQVQQYDEGAYICTGSNSQGSISTNPVYLIIASMQSTFIQEPSDVFSVLGSSVTLHCTPPISNPPATVQWYKDNIQIVSSTSFTQQDNGDMYISSLALPDTGDYFCAATNSYIPRTLTSRTATLTIQVGALITEPPQNMKVSLHNSVDLTCRADGDPKPSITWFKDQIQIDNDRYGSRYLVSLPVDLKD